VVSTNLPGMKGKTPFLYKALAIAAAACIGAVGLVNWFYLRETVLTLLIVFKVNAFAWRAIDYITMIALAMLWLSLVLASPYILLRGKQGAAFWKKTAIVIGIQAAILLVCFAILAIV
jgi:hypothetical protein